MHGQTFPVPRVYRAWRAEAPLKRAAGRDARFSGEECGDAIPTTWTTTADDVLCAGLARSFIVRTTRERHRDNEAPFEVKKLLLLGNLKERR